MNYIYRNNQEITPSKIICIGRNYVEHIEELNNEVPSEMVVFIKPNSAITDTLNAEHQEALHYEGELCFLYEQGRFVAVAFGLDLTKRRLQAQLKEKGLPWERAKAFSGSALFSEFVDINSIDDDLTVSLHIDGKLQQQGTIQQMLYKPERILAELNTFIDLEDGDIVMTGTPKGVGKVQRLSEYTGCISCQGNRLVDVTWLAK